MSEYTNVHPVQINQQHYVVCGDVQECNHGDGPVREFDKIYHNCQKYRDFWEDYCVQAQTRVVLISIRVLGQYQQGAALCQLTQDALADTVHWINVGWLYVNWPAEAAAIYACNTFIVPPGWYYKVKKINIPDIVAWVEWDMAIADRVILTDKLKPEE